jgi:ATP-binding cassette subfamily B protein
MDETETPAAGSWTDSPIWRLYSVYGRSHLSYAGLGVVSTVFGRFFGLVPAFVIGLTVDAIFLRERPFGLPLVPDAWLPTTPTAQLYVAIGVLVAATVVGAVASWLEDWSWNVFAQRVQHALRIDAYDRLQRLELAYFTSRRTGDLMSVLNNDVNALETFLEDGLSATLWVGATVVGIGAVLLALNVPLTLVTLLPIPALAVFTLVFTRVVEPKYLAIRGEIGDLNSRLENNVSGIEIIKTEGAEAYERDRVASASAAYLDANLSAIRTQITYYPGLTVISGVGFAITFLIGGLWVLTGAPFGLAASLTPGEFVTFVIYAQQFVWPVIRLGSVVDDYERAKAAAVRVTDVVTRESDVVADPDAPPLVVREGRVAFDHVSFRYGTGGRQRVLTDVSLDVGGGETVGVVGPTGAGKSTLLKLLPRLYDADDGAVRVDGQDVRDVSLASLRRAVGYVSQDPFLFFGTVRENIRYGTFEATDEDVEEAARRAQAHEFVLNLPDGYDTLVGERGVKLSGGQRQRIALARTVLKDPAILVLDEATSSVDTETEALIQRSIAEFARDRTTFVIAHRLSTVRTADRIVVVDDGRITERGTHEELLERDGLYANFWRVQAGDVDSLPAAFLERAVQRSAERADGLDWSPE